MSDRHIRGMNRLREIDETQLSQIISSLREIAPDFADHVIAFAFGDIYARPGLDLKSRQLATVAALTALGTAGPQLRTHIRGAFNVGWSREEIVEVVMQMAVYAGFPAALNGIAAVKEVLEQAGTTPVVERSGAG